SCSSSMSPVNAPGTPSLSFLSLHDALPISLGLGFVIVFRRAPWDALSFPLLIPFAHALVALPLVVRTLLPALRGIPDSLRQAARSEEHTSELQSRENLVCRLLLAKKKTNKQ